MDSSVNEKDFELLAQDPYTFEVLNRILRGKCDLVRTNHKNLILCHSEPPYPVWIWTPDGISDSEKETAWNLAEAHRPLSGGYRFNMKHELAGYFIDKGKQNGLNAGIAMQLFAYDCPAPVKPDCAADGSFHVCTQEDVEEAAGLIPQFYTEIGEEKPTREFCLGKVQAYIDEHAFFFWKNAAGKTVACCCYRYSQGLASLGSVFTLPEYRRKHYAQNLVYQVTQRVKDLGYTPMLYTNADYTASNACYSKIGYVLRGKLCTISLLSND